MFKPKILAKANNHGPLLINIVAQFKSNSSLYD